jgi:hypothetical protein
MNRTVVTTNPVPMESQGLTSASTPIRTIAAAAAQTSGNRA